MICNNEKNTEKILDTTEQTRQLYLLHSCPVFTDANSETIGQFREWLFRWVVQVDPLHNSRYTLDDSGSGRLFADAYNNIARYITGQKAWNVYDGTRWIFDEDGCMVTELCKFLGDVLREYTKQPGLFPETLDGQKQKQAYNRYLSSWFSHTRRQKIIEDAASVNCLPLSAFDQDPLLINCQNGTYNLREKRFQKHTSDDRLTHLANVYYDEAARSERFERFIDEIMCGDKEKAKFLQKVFGYCLSGETYLECMFILYGPQTRNGKSTLVETVLKVLGDYGTSTRPEVIMATPKNKFSTAANEGLARLVGVRMTNVPEPQSGMQLNAALVKSLTGNDSITARFLYRNSFEFCPQFKIVVNANNLPLIDDMTLFDSNRIYVIPFDRHFDAAEQDHTLKEQFAQNDIKSAVLNWMLQGYYLLKAEGLNPPDSVIVSTRQYAHDSDTFLLFVDECLAPAPGYMVRTSDVYKQYQSWCNTNHIQADGVKIFKASLERIGKVERKRPREGGEKTTLLLGYRLM